MNTGQVRSFINTRSPPAWSPCSCVISMPSSAFGSSPISAIRRTVSRELKPASTKTRVPLATKSTALPVEPLPSTVSFIGELRYKDTKNTKKKLNQERRTEERDRKHSLLSFLFFVFFVS